nr:unnamed protein product [Spirometra erinaceieuropaei]
MSMKVEHRWVRISGHLLQLAGFKKHARGPTMMAGAALDYGQKILFQMRIQAVEENAGEDVPDDIKPGDALRFTIDVLEMLRGFSLTPHHLEERCQMIREMGNTVPVDLSGDRVRFGRFPAEQLLHSLHCFVEKGWEVEVHVGLHLRQTGDGGVRDGGRTGEDAPEALGPSLLQLCLLSDETVVGSPVGIRNRFCHQHVLLASPPDDDIVQQVPASRPRVHPGGLLSQGKAEVGLGQEEPVFCAGSYEEQVIVIGAVETMGTQHSSLSSMVCVDAGAEVIKDNQLIRLQHSRQEFVQVLVEFVSCGVRAGHRRSVGSDDGGEVAFPERQTEAHQAILDACSRQGCRPTMSFCMVKATPASRRSFFGRQLQLALFGEPGLTECGDVHLVAHLFTSH